MKMPFLLLIVYFDNFSTNVEFNSGLLRMLCLTTECYKYFFSVENNLVNIFATKNYFKLALKCCIH